MTAANVNRAASATRFTGATFTALAVPLALWGTQPLDLSLAGITIRGQLDDYAMEYLGAAAVVSLGLGITRLGKGAGAAQAGSAASPTALGQFPASLPKASTPLLTEDTLKASGLQAFLDDDDAPLVTQPALVQPALDQSASAQPASPQAVSAHQPPTAASVSHAGDAYAGAPQNASVAPSVSPAAQPQQCQLPKASRLFKCQFPSTSRGSLEFKQPQAPTLLL